MFVGAGIWDSGLTAAEEESLFYQGYGQATINKNVLYYYRFERIILKTSATIVNTSFCLMKVVTIGCNALNTCSLFFCRMVQ